MIGIAGMVAQELVDQKTIFDHFSQVVVIIDVYIIVINDIRFDFMEVSNLK